MVVKQNLIVYQGADFRRVMELKNESSALLDLTDYIFRGQAKTAYQESSPSFNIDFVIRDQLTDPGVVDMSISSTETALLILRKETSYLYDIEMVDANGIVRRILEGTILVYPEVTK